MPKYFYSALAFSLLLMSACTQTPTATAPTASPTPAPSTLPSAKPSAPVLKPAGLKLDLTNGQGVIGGQLLDAQSGQLLKIPVQIRVTGPDQNKLEVTQQETRDGLFSLVLKKGVTPAINQPVRVTVVAQASGFFAASTTLNLTDSRHDSFALKLVSTERAPQGVAVASAAAEAAGGVLNQPFALSATESQSQSLARFALGAGTVLRDASGQALSGPLETHVGYFSNTTARSLDAFPGGFAPVVSQNGQDSNGYFITGGFVSVEISDSSGRKAAQFSQPAEITIQIPGGTVNPETGRPVAAGDTIGIWSHDPNTGKWSGEGTGKVSGPDSKGHFNVTYAASHLSYWNIDWHNSAVCNPKVRLAWDSANQIPVQVSLKFEGQDWYTPTNLLADPENQLYNVPIEKNLTFVASYNNREVGRQEVRLDASCADVNLNISTANLPAMRPVPVDLTLSGQTRFSRNEVATLIDRFGLAADLRERILNYTHPAGSSAPFTFSEEALRALEALGATRIRELKSLIETQIRPTTYLYYKTSNPNDWQWQWAYFDQGEATLNLIEGQTYDFSGAIYYNNRWYYVQQSLSLSAGQSRLRLDLQDAELTLDAVRDYLNQLIPGGVGTLNPTPGMS